MFSRNISFHRLSVMFFGDFIRFPFLSAFSVPDLALPLFLTFSDFRALYCPAPLRMAAGDLSGAESRLPVKLEKPVTSYEITG
ncbi:hypothetical protein [Agathobaculum sp.]|uniref:hypothetical protein n=1 Tax=Agathobaculum sp. TaxID=2048138 RepID=UPI00352256E1